MSRKGRPVVKTADGLVNTRTRVGFNDSRQPSKQIGNSFELRRCCPEPGRLLAEYGKTGQPAQFRRARCAPAVPGSKRDFAQNVGDIVYFTTDSSDITPEGRQTLQKQVQWLNQHTKYTITIEGHADERGTREYNIALGARRATAVRTFLSRSGVDPRRVRTVSFGKERPCRRLQRYFLLVSEPAGADRAEQSCRQLTRSALSNRNALRTIVSVFISNPVA